MALAQHLPQAYKIDLNWLDVREYELLVNFFAMRYFGMFIADMNLEALIHCYFM